MNQIKFRRVLSQEISRVDSRIAAARHRDYLAVVSVPVAQFAIVDAAPRELFFFGQRELAPIHAGSDYHCARLVDFFLRLNDFRRSLQRHALNLVKLVNHRAEMFSLLLNRRN